MVRPNLRRCDAALLPGAVAIVLAVAYLLAPRMGWDLAAQMARADFAANHPFSPIDLRWFGGTLPFGYSLWVPLLMARIGPRVVGAIAMVLATVLTTKLLQRGGAARPVVGGIAAAICQAGNLIEGRVTFAVGVVCGLGALLAVTGERRLRLTTALVLAVLAGAASPVAALLLWLCAAVAVVRRRYGDAATLALASGAPTIITSIVFADSGRQLFGPADAIRAALATAVVLVLVPARQQAIRLGAVLGLLLVAIAYLLPTPIGGNATRLSLLFALPVIAAFVPWRWWLAGLAIAITAVVQTPITFGTLAGAGADGTSAFYYAPMLAEIRAQGSLTGRVEVPELNGHWEAAFVAKQLPLARGWLRQLDTELNDDVFYRHKPTPSTYRQFLDDNAVEYVALPDARLTYYGNREATLLKSGLDYLDPIWRNDHWTLYRVTNAVPIVEAPGKLISENADSITFTAPPNSQVKINIRSLRWLDTSGGCLADDGASVLYQTGATTATSYTISSAWRPHGHC